MPQNTISLPEKSVDYCFFFLRGEQNGGLSKHNQEGDDREKDSKNEIDDLLDVHMPEEDESLDPRDVSPPILGLVVLPTHLLGVRDVLKPESLLEVSVLLATCPFIIVGVHLDLIVNELECA